jgi:mycothiol synthase
MSDFPYVIRNYRPDDFDNYIRLNVEAEKLDPGERCTSPKVLGERLGRPNYHPEQDLFIAEAAGKVIGHIDVTPELAIGRVVLDCLVHPQHRRKGLAKELSYYAIRRARELGAQVAHVNITQDNVAAKNLLSKLGFGPVRRFLELRLQLSKGRLPDVEQTALLCHHLQCGEEDKLAQIQNRSFTDTWGYNPNTTEEILYRVNLSNCSPRDVILASEEDEPIGYCWTTINMEEGESKGQIYMLGVDPGHRGRGIGKLLLLAGLSYLKSRGVAVAGLTVDSQNRAACALYESVGFKISSTTLWYEKVLD